MKPRNPCKSHKNIPGAHNRTLKQLETYHGKVDLLRTWEQQPEDIQIRFHDDIIRLKAKIRNVKNYILNRADPIADVLG